MLSTIFGKKSDHPLADLKSAQALLDDLPRTMLSSRSRKCLIWWSYCRSTPSSSWITGLPCCACSTRLPQPHLRKLVREYFTPFEISKFQENRLWLLLSKWSDQIATAYFRVYTEYCNGEKAAVSSRRRCLC